VDRTSLSLFDTIVGNATRRVIPFGGTATDLTIAEAQPPEDFFNRVFTEFGSAFYTMLAGLAFLAIRPLLGRKFRAEHTLVIVWALFLISMAATQVRFMYYLTLAVAVVNAAFVAEITRLFDLDLERGLDSIRQVETYQVIVVLLVVLLLFAPLLPPLAQATAWERGEQTGVSGSATTWEESNHWLKENTPAPGNYGGANNADELDYYGTYTPGDGDYEYPGGLRRHVVVGLRPPDNDAGRTDSPLEPVPAERAVVVGVPDCRVRGTGGTDPRRDRCGRTGRRSVHRGTPAGDVGQ